MEIKALCKEAIFKNTICRNFFQKNENGHFKNVQFQKLCPTFHKTFYNYDFT